MATTVFNVTPETLEASANSIEEKAAQFQKAHESIYTAVGDLMVSYKGEASQAFNSRIDEYKNDFSSADTALKNYVQFLRDYAAKMKNTETDLQNQANNLSVGN